MRNFLFAIIVIILIPVYLIIKLFNKVVKAIMEMTEPIAEGIDIIVEDMVDFWKKILKGK